MIQDVKPGSGFFFVPDPGVNKNIGPWIPDLVPQYCNSSWTFPSFQVRLLSIVHYNEVKRLLDKRAALLVDVRYPTILVVRFKGIDQWEVGWQWYHSIGLALSCSGGNFRAPRTLFLSFDLKTITVSQQRFVGALWKVRETCLLRGEFKHRHCSLPTLQISLGIVSLFDKICYGEPILTVVSNIGEDVT